MFKFDVNAVDLYMVGQPIERTKERLLRIATSGLELLSGVQFGLSGVVSGLYIEKVWMDSDEDFDDYLNWMVSKLPSNENLKLTQDKCMVKISELCMGFYDDGNDITKDFMVFEAEVTGTGELSVTYPNGHVRKVLYKQIDVPNVNIKDGRSDMFVFGDITSDHIKKCIDEYQKKLSREIEKLRVDIERLTIESNVWKNAMNNYKIENQI
jgi:hypothetical protein